MSATHRPGSLELNLGARLITSETVANANMAANHELARATGGKQPLAAPQSISASIAANGKEAHRLAGAKCAAWKSTKGATSAANLTKPNT